jgi:tetratricopeptide (TPR) repeat protein
MSVVFHNLGELATYSGNLTEAEALCRRSLVLAEQVHDREYQSLWNADLATILQEQGKLEEAKVSVCRALKIGRVIHNAPCMGLALVALGTVRMAQAKAVRDEEGGGERIASRLLLRARASLEQALALEGLEVETRTRGYLALAHVLFLLGQVELARREAVRAMEETRRYELMSLVAQCKRLLEEIPVQKM